MIITLDDFETGYSSLSYLQSFPLDKIKIDKSFVHQMESNPQALSIVKAIIGLSLSLGIRITAEGIKTTRQLVKLME
ncbi:EAL domain-containing protein [Pseudomonas sp. LTJR-52]|uniref:EAL domain-containing protein n=1 Tax=Pseudomonas sp. LTJR-52 TaxID=2479392 RepID=UPI0013CF3A3C